MKYFTLPNILLVTAVSVIVIAISLAGGSISKSVKWNVYEETKVYSPNYSFHLYAYQTLWTSADINGQVYRPAKRKDDEHWRPLVRVLVMSSVGPGTLSLVTLLLSSLIPPLKRKVTLLIISRIVSSILSTAAGVILGYALALYKTKYPSLLLIIFYAADYPGKDSVSTGFYMASTASALYFISVVINTVSIVLLVKTLTSILGQDKIGPASSELGKT